MEFAVVDIETTGSHARGHGITEIAVVVTDGRQILERWETLVDPGAPIPRHITTLTGIDDDMLAGAPAFHQIADTLREKLEGRVFVAHNVGFDHTFIRDAFEASGTPWRAAQRACSVRLARKLLPGHASYGLGNLCRDLGIENSARHRAMGDAEATATLLHLMMARPHAETIIADVIKRGSREHWLPQHVPVDDYERLPEGPGVYRFLDAGGKPLYIGMSHQVQHRVRSHFTGKLSSARRQAFLRDIRNIVAEPTGSTLLARLIEDVLIRAHMPLHNRAQKRWPVWWFVTPYKDRLGRLRLAAKKGTKSPGREAIRFRNEVEARNWLFRFAATHNLPEELLGLGVMPGQSQAIPTDEAARGALNAAMADAWQTALADGSRNEFALLAPGREEGETAVVHLVGGSPQGWGFTTESIDATGSWLEAVEPQPPSSTLDAIVGHALEGLANRDREFRSLRLLRREPVNQDQFRWVTGDPTEVG
jgi:DNA polymerase-3 subunit epsilon